MVPSLADLTNAGYGPYIAQLKGEGYSESDAELQAAFKQAADAVHGLAVTLAAFEKANNATGIADTKAQLAYWSGQLSGLQAALNRNETPGAVLTALDTFSEDATSVLRGAGVGLEGTLSGLGSLLQHLPLLLGLTVAVVVVVWLWKSRVLERADA